MKLIILAVGVEAIGIAVTGESGVALPRFEAVVAEGVDGMIGLDCLLIIKFAPRRKEHVCVAVDKGQ